MLAALALLLASADPVAAVPLFRDPVHDGAADASTVHDPKTGEWVMFYTNRRADLKLADPKDVSWVHGTAIGVARSKDGATWRYSGTAAIPESCTGATLWAPEVQRFGGKWHMWITVVPGVFANWNAPRFLVHLTSPDLKRWDCGERVELGSDRIIDASVLALPQGGYRMWFNDERMGKAIRWADSTDLKTLDGARHRRDHTRRGPQGVPLARALVADQRRVEGPARPAFRATPSIGSRSPAIWRANPARARPIVPRRSIPT
jgi:hypothetical protein